MRAVGGEDLGDAFADAAAGAGDQRDLAGQVKRIACTHGFIPLAIGHEIRPAMLLQVGVVIKIAEAEAIAAV
jgi:hypothetical protein